MSRRRQPGCVRAVSGGSLTLLERDGTVVVVPVAADAEVRLTGRVVPFSRLRRGMSALTVREGDGAASVVRATR